MGVRADIVATARATVGHIIRFITGGAVNEMPNRQYLDFAGNCTVQDDGTGIKVTVPEVPAGSVTVGNVTTLPPGDMAYVTNTGTPIHAILNFGVPVGQEPPASDTSLGITRLSDSVNSSSNAATGQTAASPLSVKTVNDALTALDTAAVHKAGAETISGAKTFSEAITGNLTGNVSGNAGTATKLASARSLKTDLASSTAVTFDGSADQNAIPVTGTLPIANGGTGSATQNFIDLTTNQMVAGVKTFASSPIVPTPAANDDSTKAASTAYVDAAAGVVSASVTALDNSAVHKTGDEEIAGVKSFSNNIHLKAGRIYTNGNESDLWIYQQSSVSPLTENASFGCVASNSSPYFCAIVRHGGNEYWLKGASNGNLTWKNNKVLTGADVFVGVKGPMSTSDIVIPSGGTWKYFFSSQNISTYTIAVEAYSVAGGTNLTSNYPATDYWCRVIAIKVAD